MALPAHMKTDLHAKSHGAHLDPPSATLGTAVHPDSTANDAAVTECKPTGPLKFTRVHSTMRIQANGGTVKRQSPGDSHWHTALTGGIYSGQHSCITSSTYST